MRDVLVFCNTDIALSILFVRFITERASKDTAICSFNSLCEIHLGRSFGNLEGLSNTFNSLCEIPLPGELVKQIGLFLTFNSLCEIHRRHRELSRNSRTSFQFSLWDSWVSQNGKLRWLSTFNSLCEILVTGKISNDLIPAAFNSLCEIQLLIQTEMSLLGLLSILFVRFEKTFF